MRLVEDEDLLRALSEISYLGLDRRHLQRIREFRKVHVFFQRVGLEQVVGELGTVAPLKISKDEVDPFVQVGAHEVRLQGKAVFHDEVLRTGSPTRQSYVVHPLFEVVEAQVEIVRIPEEAAVAEVKLGGHFFVVGEKLEDVLPGNVDVVEDFVGRTSHGFILQFQDVAGHDSD